jgi:hypothetical protein
VAIDFGDASSEKKVLAIRGWFVFGDSLDN